MSPLMLII